MSKLRQAMIEAMHQRGYTVCTHRAYRQLLLHCPNTVHPAHNLGAVTDLARHYRRSPDKLDAEEVKPWLRHLAVERGLSGASCRQYSHAAKFLYLKVLEWVDIELEVALPKQPHRIPELLTRQEVAQTLAACNNVKHRTILMPAYGCGLRVSEIPALRLRYIDGERKLFLIEEGNGAKDRMVPSGPALLACLAGLPSKLLCAIPTRGLTAPHNQRPK